MSATTTGMSLTGSTVMFTAAESVKNPPAPVLPKSLVEIFSKLGPLKLLFG